jgi:hypothetical protein
MIEKQTRQDTAWLLKNRDRLSLDKAINYLVARLRTLTPLGAVEFLASRHPDVARAVGHEPDEVVDARVGLARRKMEMYEALFPREYRASQAPPFSIQREHEFYELVAGRLIPVDLTPMEKEPAGFLPFIPIEGTQQHDWEAGCCKFDQLQLMFKLALTLTGRKRDGWRLLGLEKPPAPPLNAAAWTFFVYALMVERTPLRYLKHAIDLTCYATGNVWLDVRTTAGMEWSAHNLGRLYIERLRANQINLAVGELEEWLQADPKTRIGRAVELWNAAAAAGEFRRRSEAQ